MAKQPSDTTLSEVKKRLLDALFMDNLLGSSNGQSEGKKEDKATQKVIRGMNDIPVAKMIAQVQFIQENLLPRIKKKGGEDSADYILFSQVTRSLLYAVLVIDRLDIVSIRLAKEKTFNHLLRQHNEYIEAELLKYTTLEDLFLTESLDRYTEGIKHRVEALLKKQKG